MSSSSRYTKSSNSRGTQSAQDERSEYINNWLDHSQNAQYQDSQPEDIQQNEIVDDLINMLNSDIPRGRVNRTTVGNLLDLLEEASYHGTKQFTRTQMIRFDQLAQRYEELEDVYEGFEEDKQEIISLHENIQQYIEGFARRSD